MRKRVIGIVTSDKMQKTRRVEVPRLYKHPKYGKTLKTRTVCHVHDENNDAHLGDTVEIIESRPHSKTKRWDLIRVLERSREPAAVTAAAVAAAAAEASATTAATQEAAPQAEHPETEAETSEDAGTGSTDAAE